MQEILERYGMLLQEVDNWLATCLATQGGSIACRSGCSACCRGLFDITILDALYLKAGFDRLPPDRQSSIRLKAKARLDAIQAGWPAFSPPWVLNTLPEPEWDLIMPDDDETPCVMLSEEGQCLVYAHRPMTCRLNGIPLIDVSGEELFDEWCTLNFTDIDPRTLEELRHPFRELFAQELLLFRELTKRLLGRPVNELDTVIPAAAFLESNMLSRLSGDLPADKDQ
ncbi:YkgJ family cysteine cluster protein [Geobacter sp. SVR]|uniref:YkgJ family cysteine cluster protein n=1 Tax=Geobacter sp. SVR TaxID=2495594 RepID=UPI00143EFFD8|nr:YkgJ family cysteine cluster protein [Geobacter sp. SVR]BCS53831.1 hypothetical protein GSVR_21390 [Geobacter sp. SVR]GCF85660.1 hypothetical protein GSbR_22600 [Geobacter sp. SVR]